MKRLFYILTSLLVLSSCTDELSVYNEYNNVREGDNVKVQFSINAPEEGIAETRTLGEMTDTDQNNLNLWLFVFDSNGLFVQAAKADATGRTTSTHQGSNPKHSDTNFTVTLNATSYKRIIHFVAFDGSGENSGLASLISNVINSSGTEVDKIARELFTTAGQAAYWQRIEVDRIEKIEGTLDGIPKGQFAGKYKTDCVPLVRNFAKISVKNEAEAEGFTYKGFTIVNAPEKGTIAPYKGGFVEFVNGKTQKSYEDLLGYEGSTPKENSYSTSTTIDTSDKYLYETPNASGDVKGRTSIVVYGKYNGKDSYYKVDLIYDPIDETGKIDETAGHMFYNILRNFEYKVTINHVTGDGHAKFDQAVAGAASNNLSSSTVTANLSRISDGVQMLEVTNTYFMFTRDGFQEVLKYRYSYSANGTNWTTNNDLVKLTNSNNNLFTEAGRPNIDYSSDNRDDAEGWRTVTMTLNAPTAQAQTSNLHIYASRSAIEALTEQDIDPDLKKSILSGELLYRDVRVDLRTPYRLIVAPQSYVSNKPGTQMRVDLLIPVGVNEGLFPLDFYVEDNLKYLYPDTYIDQETKKEVPRLPVHVGKSVVTGSTDQSFQYTRTLTKEEFNILQTTTVDGNTYKVIPCYFKTSVGDPNGAITGQGVIRSDATRIYAGNEYFAVNEPGKFSNIPSAFRDKSTLEIESGTMTYFNTVYQTTELFGRNNPVKLTFYITEQAWTNRTQNPFILTVKETVKNADGTETVTGNPVRVNLSNANPVSFTDDNGQQYTYYRQVYTYLTQTMNGYVIDADVKATMQGGTEEVKKATLPMDRTYFIIKKESFTTNMTSDPPISVEADGSSIYINDGLTTIDDDNPYGTAVGWFGGQFDSDHNADGYLDANGPRADYVIDREYQGKATLTDNMPVVFKIYDKNRTVIAAGLESGDPLTLKVLDDARTNTVESQKPKVIFKLITSSGN